MAILLVVLSLAGLSLAYEAYARPRQHIGLLATCCAVVLLHYVAGMLHLPLYTASYTVMLAGAIAWGWISLSLFHHRLSPRAFLSAFLFLLVAGAVYWQVKDGYLKAWDDFSHWAVMAKELYFRHGFAQRYAETSVLFVDYPPGSALFYYYFLHFTAFTEGGLLFAHALFLLAISLSVLPRDGGAPRWWGLLLPVVWLSFAWNADAYRSLFVDGWLGGLFGAAILTFCSERDKPLRAICLAAPILIALPIIKASGTFFVFLAVLLMCSILLYQSYPWRDRLRAIGALSLVLCVAWGGQALWKASVKEMPNVMARPSYSLHTLLSEPPQAGEEDKYEKTISAFWQRGGASLTSRGDILLFSLVALSLLLAWQRGKQSLRQTLAMQAAMTGGFALYTAGLLALYLTSFTYLESIGLASFERYLSTYMAGWLLVAVYITARLAPAIGEWKAEPWLTRAAALIAVGFVLYHYSNAPLSDPTVERQRIRAEVAGITPLILQGKQLYIVWDGYTSFDCFIANYELTPALMKGWQSCSNYQRPYPEPSRLPADFGTKTLPLVPFTEHNTAATQADAYDWLFIPRGDAVTRQTIGRHFAQPQSVGEDSLFFYQDNLFHAEKQYPLPTK